MADPKYTGINPPLAPQAPLTPKDNSDKKQDEDLETPSVMQFSFGAIPNTAEAKRLGYSITSPLMYKRDENGELLKRKEGEEYAQDMAKYGKPQYTKVDMKPTPQDLFDGAQKTNKDLGVPNDTAWVSEIKDIGHTPDSAFRIPGHNGEWALFVDKKYIGTGPGQVSAEGWANAAKKLGQSAPRAAPATPH